MAKRDSKGRWEKGESGNPETQFKSAQESGREMEEIRRRGGHNSQIVKREKQTFAELCNMIGVIDASVSDKENIKRLGIDPETADKATQDFVVAAAQYMRAKAGDTRAATWIRDTKGENVVNVNVNAQNTELRFEDIMPKNE